MPVGDPFTFSGSPFAFQQPQSEYQVLRQATDEAVQRLIREHRIAVDRLTEKQLAAAIVQAISCGDFVRHIRIDDNAQTIDYAPYRELDSAQRKIRELESHIAAAAKALTTEDQTEP